MFFCFYFGFVWSGERLSPPAQQRTRTAPVGQQAAIRQPAGPDAGVWTQQDVDFERLLSVFFVPLRRMRAALVVLILLVVPHRPASTAPVPVFLTVGDSVTLPCDGTPAAGIPEDQLHVQWKTPTRPVLDFHSGRAFPGPGFEPRAQVSREKIRQGDFSLSLLQASFSDSGLYECFHRGTDGLMKFLGSVHLRVTARTEGHTRRAGEDLSVPLGVGGPVVLLLNGKVVYPEDDDPKFKKAHVGGRGIPIWQRVWVQDGSLTLRSLTPADQGSYTVRDLQGNTISTVIVTVEARRDNVTLQAGASLSVPLFTGDPVEVLFDPAGSGDWTSVCSVQSSTASCVPQYRDRVSVDNQELRLQELRASDQGSYTVRDLQGNNISTVIVSVEGSSPGARWPGGLQALLCVVLALGVGVLSWWRWRDRKRLQGRTEAACVC